MTIDIISYTDEQFAAMTEEQILEVESVQLKKKSAHEKTGGGKENGKIPTAESGDIPFPRLGKNLRRIGGEL